MSKIEYKTILLPYKTGLFQGDSTDLTASQQGRRGRLAPVADRAAVDGVGPREHHDRDHATHRRCVTAALRILNAPRDS